MKALIVTCGGLCPGMNVVIREIVETLWWNYDVKDIFGAKFGYGGIYKYPLIKLDHDFVKFIHY